jgi:hypothetical protein
MSVGTDGVRLPTNIRQRVTNGTLTVENVQRSSDQGTYSCTARNKQNFTAQRSVDIRVLGKYSRNYWNYDDDDDDVDEIRIIGGGIVIEVLKVYRKMYFPCNIRQLNFNIFMGALYIYILYIYCVYIYTYTYILYTKLLSLFSLIK